ncbi:unnamed protein product [Pieris macdunnoughi]|uniref:Uncharacterized protein n=1 Tax=Pieris macdunnoughi TaxID=345717 RepID=A0A821U0P5_9NEOP|nr:unnamed protein product [Pieris macdunnoughi]
MERLRFDFIVKPSEDEKSNIICIDTIATTGGQVFAIPAEFQPANLHLAVIKTPNYIKVKKSLKKRYQTRKVWITITEELSNIYLDEEQNIQFNDFYLEEILKKVDNAEPIPSGSNESFEKLLEKLIEKNKQNLKLQI